MVAGGSSITLLQEGSGQASVSEQSYQVLGLCIGEQTQRGLVPGRGRDLIRITAPG